MSLDFRVISIGTLDAHPLWNETAPCRTGHATTTLITVPPPPSAARVAGAKTQHILVDPSLPPTALLARMSERTPTQAHEITQVFLTSFDPVRRRALECFDHAQWLVHGPERESARLLINEQLQQAKAEHEHELERVLEKDLELLERTADAPDALAPGVDLFPMPGVTFGCCGLLLPLPSSTVLICGDAIPTMEHLAQAKVLPHSINLKRAQESFKEAVEIADVLVLGRDNVTMNPVRSLM